MGGHPKGLLAFGVSVARLACTLQLAIFAPKPAAQTEAPVPISKRISARSQRRHSMLTIRGEHGSAPDGDDHLFMMKQRDTHLLATTLTGPCEDDCESTAPYIGMCLDESRFEDGPRLLSYGGISPTED